MTRVSKIIERMKKVVKTHKVASLACTGALVLGLGVGGVGIANAINLKNTQNAVLEQMAENGDLSAEDVQKLADSGQLGQEIVDPNTGETVVLTQNEDGTVTKTVVADANGNSTGATVPENHSSNGNTSGGGNSGGNSGDSGSGGSSDTPAVHTHSWVAHTATRQVQTGTRYVVDVPAQAAVYTTEVHEVCNSCGGYVDTQAQEHQHIMNGCNGCSHTEGKKVLVTPAVAEQGHNEAVYTTETYVDYYYCSECGARQ